MIKYDYIRVEDRKHLSELLRTYGDTAKMIAGGTDLMVQIREQSGKLSNMKMMLDISSLENQMKYIRVDSHELVIGALSTHTDIEKNIAVQRYLPICIPGRKFLLLSQNLLNRRCVKRC